MKETAIAIPKPILSDNDIPGDAMAKDVDWHRSTTKLSNLLSPIAGADWEVKYRRIPGGVEFSGHGVNVDLSTSTEDEMQRICDNLEAWLVYTDECEERNIGS